MAESIANKVKSFIKTSAAYRNLSGNEIIKVNNLDGYPLSRAVELWQRKLSCRLLVIVPSEENARNLIDDLSDVRDIPVVYFPSSGKQLYSSYSASVQEAGQLKAIEKLESMNDGIIVTHVRAFSSPVISRQSIRNFSIRLKTGDHFDSTGLASRLAAAGYYKASSCYEVGTFALRGEVMEIFPYQSEYPIRLYADWDEIGRIAYYDPSSQQVIRNISSYSLSLINENTKVETDSFTSCLKGNEYVFFVGSERCRTVYTGLMNEAKQLFKAAYASDAHAPVPEKILTSPFDYLEGRKSATVVYDIRNDDESFHFDINAGRSFFGNVKLFKEEAGAMLANSWDVRVIVPTQIQEERMTGILSDLPDVKIEIGNISRGFSVDALELFVIADQEIFNRRTARRQALVNVQSEAIDSFVDLKEGDYVVHVNYGIGQFVKIERAKTSRAERDYIKIRYADEEYLYVPIEQANLVQRYIGNDGRAPKLDKMGTSSWSRKKEKAVKKAQELASQLISLYAKRQNSFGYPFKKDTDWQLQFEASFPFTETPDQLKCIEDIKKDMESDKVMDRLVCGDVGYGKTEIAFRAAFKAVMSGRQVAFLAPTTILAEQHYRKFCERLGEFPVQAEQLSRIVPAARQRKVLSQLKEGKVDILFGTHKILQKNVVFKNLGLLIIDEEQRFGVTAKEKIKQLKVNVDCLTLSATPIPRTLYMSLLKVRDMSLLTTAPRERLPIKTIIDDYDINKVVAAIQKELERGGQVFYLHNRISDLNDIAYQLHSLIPSATVEYAHGQMESDELEDIMHRFVYGGIQVLVSTTIIENGIDIPNVNTIIIDNAHMFGLSQLYQLRGRVGRSDRQAYCYLMYPDESMLNDDAIKRLRVLSEHTALGSGFKVAMKDMEIRGAGNLLGQEQSGQLEAVGLDMYMKILDEEINRLTHGEKAHNDREVYLELDYSGFIPDSYISDPSSKFDLYKKIASVKTDYEFDALKGEVEERFGPVPEEVENLFCIAQIRIVCRRLEIYHLSESRGIVQIEFSHFSAINPDKIINLLKLSNGRVKMDAARPNYMKMKTDAISLKDKAYFILEQLRRLE